MGRKNLIRLTIWQRQRIIIMNPSLPCTPPIEECVNEPSQCPVAMTAVTSVSSVIHQRMRVTGLLSLWKRENQLLAPKMPEAERHEKRTDHYVNPHPIHTTAAGSLQLNPGRQNKRCKHQQSPIANLKFNLEKWKNICNFVNCKFLTLMPWKRRRCGSAPKAKN